MKKHPNAVRQSRRFNKEQIKKQLLDSFVYNEINKEDLIAKADNVQNCQEATKIMKECENMIKTNKENIMRFAYEQDKIFKKFKEDTKFKNLVEQFRRNRTTTIFKINIVKLADKYPKILTLSVTLNFLKRTLKVFVKKIQSYLAECFTSIIFGLLIKGR